jgi:GntR family transcriptional regulator/MocR family aminotransferase
MLRPWKLELQLVSSSSKALYLQIADAIIQDIQSGRLKSGNALPGSRNLATQLNINRNTVVDALNVLLAEGWLVSKERRGTFVADILPTAPSGANRNASTKSIAEEGIPKKKYSISIDDGHPDSKIAPVKELARAYRQLFNRKARWQMMGYGDPMGELKFRKEIGQMLNHQRGLKIHAHNICITRGSQMAMYLVAQCMLQKGDYVLIENPGYKPAWKAFENAGAKLLPVRIDEEGIVLSDVIRHLKSGKKIKALYTTPHRQYPTTVTMSLSRRMELIGLSNRYGFTIIEDDYDNEFHFGYRPVLPISSFSELKNYVYIGTMSKVVAPALRIGYLATNNTELLDRIGTLRKIIDVQGDSIMEQAVLQLIQDGTIRRHIKKATLYYKNKRDYTVLLLKKYLNKKARYHIPEGGLAFWVVPLHEPDWQKISETLKSKGIKITTPDHYSYKTSANGIRIGYGALSEAQLKEGIQTLALYL